MKTKNWKNFSLLTSSGLIFCMIIGFALAGTKAILPGHDAFQFTFFGLFGSLLYAVLKFSSTRDFLFVTILFFLLDVVLIGHSDLTRFIVHGINVTFFAVSIFVYVKILEQDNQNLFLSNIFSISGITAFALLFAVIVLLVFSKYKFEYSFLEEQTFTGLLIGLGLGIGFHLYHRYQSKIKYVNDMKA